MEKKSHNEVKNTDLQTQRAFLISPDTAATFCKFKDKTCIQSPSNINFVYSFVYKNKTFW